MMGRRVRATTVMLCPLHKPLRDLGSYPFGRLRNHAIDDGFEVLGSIEHRELTVGARAVAHDLECILYLAPATQLIYDVVDEPLQHLGDQLAGRKLLFLAEINQLTV